MPFITIELSEKIQFSLTPFALEVHRYLSPRLNAPIELFKTKLIRLQVVYVGDNEQEIEYARLKIELKKGRDKKMLQESQKELLERFLKALQKQNPHMHCRITVEFSELDPDLFISTAI